MEFIELIRKFRVGPFAVFDLAISYLGIFLITPILTKLALKAHLHISKAQWLWLVIPISIVSSFIWFKNTFNKNVSRSKQLLFTQIRYYFDVIYGIKRYKNY